MTNILAKLKDCFSANQYNLLECWDALGFPTEADPDDRWTAPKTGRSKF